MNLAFTGTQKNFNIFYFPVSLTEHVRIIRQGGRDGQYSTQDSTARHGLYTMRRKGSNTNKFGSHIADERDHVYHNVSEAEDGVLVVDDLSRDVGRVGYAASRAR